MMKTRKLLCMILVVATISCFSSMPSFAFSTPSEATPSSATSSNAFPMDDYFEFDEFDTLERPVLTSDGGVDFESTVDLSKCYFRFSYFDGAGQNRSESIYLDSNGYFTTPVLGDEYSGFSWCSFVIPKAALPRTGNYNLNFHFSSNTGGFTYTKVQFQYLYGYTNAQTEWNYYTPVSYTQASGDLSVNCNFEMKSGVSEIRLTPTIKDFQIPFGGYISVSFTRLASGSVDVVAPIQPSDEEHQANISENTSKMADTLEEIVQTISNQLEALWDQMFNLMHVPQLANDDKNTGLITGAIEEQIDADRQNTEDIIAAEESNTTTIINNNNENTEKLTNGYDNSALNAENDKLNNSLTEYDNAEKQVMDKVNHALDDINFNQSLDNYMQPILLCSTFMQRLYDNSGGFKDVINLTLIVSIASIVIGIYRFKGGD